MVGVIATEPFNSEVIHAKCDGSSTRPMAPKPRSVTDGVVPEACKMSGELFVRERSSFPKTIHSLPDFAVCEALRVERDVVLIKDLRRNIFFVQSRVLKKFHWRAKVKVPNVYREVASSFVCVGYDAVRCSLQSMSDTVGDDGSPG